MPAGLEDELITIRRRGINLYWAQRKIYEECGWPSQLRARVLMERKIEWNEQVSLRSDGELDSYYRMLAGNNAV